jgi:hypothetical protein
MDFNNISFEDIFRSTASQDPFDTQLKQRYPNFIKYPKYMQDALIENERLQRRSPKSL